MNTSQSLERTKLSADQHIQAVTRSALWAAAGDAVGWITELSHGPSGVKRRTGTTKVSKPVEWKRVIGGRNGPTVKLPAGTYSDDTQLRLAVSRAIRGNGAFDVEAFAKIELTVWPSYALGGGLGTKAAALNLSKRGVNWFSNFFENGSQSYIQGGGNGAAMRIQPHVWASREASTTLILDVLKNALVTHGHPQGFFGALFHAFSLTDALANQIIPSPEIWYSYVDRLHELPNIVDRDPQLAAFWRSTWESSVGSSLEVALEATHKNCRNDVSMVIDLVHESSGDNYHQILNRLGCLDAKFRGSGFKTALASLALAYMFRDSKIEDALLCSANELDSDTDTIATMAGALLGATSEENPTWEIQDKEYITTEAQRLSNLAFGIPQAGFSYPDLGRWDPPTSQNTSVGLSGDKFAIAGLGILVPNGSEYQAGDAIWQWFSLPFGQTILAKRKANLKGEISMAQLPNDRADGPGRASNVIKVVPAPPQPELPFEQKKVSDSTNPLPLSTTDKPHRSIDSLTDEAIQSNFDESTLGRLLNQCIDSFGSVEAAIAFSVIVAKAKLARKRRNR